MADHAGDDPTRRTTEKWLTFCYTKVFLREWKALDYTDDGLRELEAFISDKPKSGAVIAGSGGLRKLRWARTTGGGKSGGSRIGYGYFQILGHVLMVAVFAKGTQANFTAQEKSAIKQVLERYARENRRGTP